MKSFSISGKAFITLSILIISITCQDDDIIDLTDYTYPKITDYYTYIPILSTNDLHGGIFPSKYADSNKKRFSNGGGNYIYSYKKILEEEWGNRLIWLDSGDQFQGTMECMLSDCLIMKDFYNKAGLDGITLGNHDFDYGADYLKEYVKKMDFPLILANLKEVKSGKYVYETWENTYAYRIYTKIIDETDPTKVIKIGVIGLATKKTFSMSASDLTEFEITDYVEETKKWNDYLRKVENVSAVIALTHFGPYCENDGREKYVLKMRDSKTNQKMCDASEEANIYMEQLKKENIEINAVVAGHVHDVVHHWVADIPVVQSSGSDYFNILYLPFTYNKNKKQYEFKKDMVKIEGPVPVCEKLWPKYKNCEYKYEDSTLMKKFKFHNIELNLDSEMKKTLEYWEKIINEKVDNDFVEAEDELIFKLNEETLISNFINDLGRKITESDVCFYNSGGIRTDWHKGPINELDVFRMFPFNNTWVRFEMTGEEIYHMFQDLDKSSIYPSSGMVQTFSYQKRKFSVKNLLIYDGFEEKPLNFKKTYKVCTNDFLANGGSAMGDVRKWYKELRNLKDFGNVRDLVKNYLIKMKGKIREDKFVDKNHPNLIIEN